MASTLSLHGKGLKLNTREDIAPYLEGIDATLLEEIHLGGNTIGVEASQALAEFLAKTQVLKVRKINYHSIRSRSKKKTMPSRLLTSQISSQVD